MRSYRGLIVAIAGAVVVAVGAVVILFATGVFGPSREEKARDALSAFLTGWPSGQLEEVAFVDATGTPVPSAAVASAIPALSGELAEQPPALGMTGLTLSGDTATAEITVDWPLPGGATWSYRSPVRLLDDGGWRVIWEPAVVHPELVEGDALQLRRLPSTRADILAGDGEPLVTAREVVDVGIEPRAVSDLDALVAELESALQTIDPSLELDGLAEDVEAAEPDAFVPVITLRREDYQRVEDRIYPLPGTRFPTSERHLGPSRSFARALLGTVDQVLAEDIENNPGIFEAGDYTGHGGLSGAYDEQLRGVVGQSVVIARTAADGTVTDTELERIEPVPGADLATSLDVDVQRAAEAALAGESSRAALVAIRVSDGAVLAVANTQGEAPLAENIALTGAVPPGSTFKMVSAYALLDAGEVELDTPVDCPAEYPVEGFPIGNAFDGDRGQIPFSEAVAISCNTAFAALASRLGDDGLAAAGAALGIGGDWSLGIETATGSVSTGGSELERAVAAFGQGDTQVSPAAMAAATAAVARGAWLPPTLVVDPGAAVPAPQPLPEATVADLRAALRLVVTDGTASALAGIPGGEVYGKTGTAEAGEDEDGEQIEHAWFVGWQGDVAVAIFIEGGGSGSGTAVPLAEDFLRSLAG
jgi:cell division protein FtsI/penicillin-binding protein 2